MRLSKCLGQRQRRRGNAGLRDIMLPKTEGPTGLACWRVVSRCALRASAEHASQPAPLWDRTCNDPNSLCYNSVSGQGQLLWVGFACRTVLEGV